MVLVVRNGAGLRIFAAEADTQPLISLDLALHDDFELTSLVYERPLAALGLQTGAVELDRSGGCGARPLPEPSAIYVSGAERDHWQPVGEVSEAIAALQIQGTCPCADFDIESTTPLDAIPRVVIQDSRSLLLFMGSGRIIRAYADGRMETVSSTIGPSKPSAAVLAPDGELWVSAVDGLWSGRPETGFEHRASLVDQGSLLDLSGGMGPSGFEIYGSTGAGSVAKFESSGVKIVSERTDLLSDADQRGRLAWTGPGEVVASEEGTYELVLYSETRAIRRLYVPLETRGIRVLKAIEGFGVIGLGHLGTPFWIKDGQFQDLPRPPDVAPPNGLMSFEGGFIYAGESGYLQQYHPTQGYCPIQYVGDRPRLFGVARLGEHLAVWAPALGGGHQLIWLRPRL